MSDIDSITFILPIYTGSFDEYRINELVVALIRVAITGDNNIFNSAINTILSDLSESDLRAYEERMLREECELIKDRILPQIVNMLIGDELEKCKKLLKSDNCCIHADIPNNYEVVFSITDYPS